MLKTPAIQARYDELLNTLTSIKAMTSLAFLFEQHLSATSLLFSGEIDTLRHCKGNLQDLHGGFQFQHVNVSMFDTLHPLSWAAAKRYGKNLGMSDITTALANFGLYATVAKAHITREQYPKRTPQGNRLCVRPQVRITHIYVYARDSYSFYDKGKASQYLGHWNSNGVIILPDAAVASWVMKKVMDDKEPDSLWNQQLEVGTQNLPPYPVDVLGKLQSKDIYYPIRNRDYQTWRGRKGRGGDFLIYSDMKLIKLQRPIELDLGELCG